jgi:ADP-ribose pyrophosphatase
MDRYEQLRQARPELFRNQPGGIEILTDPAEVLKASGTSGIGVMYEDPYVILVRDPVRFPDGRLGTYVRQVTPAGAVGCVVLPLLGDQVVLIGHFRHADRSWHWEVPRGFGTAGLSGEQNAAKELREEIGAEADELIPLGQLNPDTGMVADPVLLYAARINSVGEVEVGEAIRSYRTLPVSEAEAYVRDGRITCGFTIGALYRARLAGLFG